MAAINYVAAAAAYDPNVSFKKQVDPTNYDSLVWSTTPISENILEEFWLGMEKKRKIKELTDAMVAEVQLGFQSDVLSPGTFRRYDTDIQSQIALIGGYVYSMIDADSPTGRSYSVSSYDLNTGIISFDLHTPAQMHTLFDALANFSNNLIQKLTSKINQILAINEANPHDSLDLLYAITWN